MDVYGDPQTFGKNIGGDILADKKTILLIHAMKAASAQQYATLQHYRSPANERYTPAEKIAAITAIYNELNIRETVQTMIRKYYRLAMQELLQLQLPPERLTALREAGRQLMERVS